MKTKIVADSSSDLLALEGVDFASVPLKIITDKKEYVDDASLDVAQMIEELKEYKGRSYTSCPNVADWAEAFEDADRIFAVAITSGLSGSYGTAVQARQICLEKHPEKQIYVIDSLSAGPELVLIVEKLRELIQKGESFESICETIETYAHNAKLLFALESLHNFVQNGRIGKLAAVAAGVLGIRILGIASEEGKLELLTKCRGAAKTIAGFISELKRIGYSGGKAIIGHCLNIEAAETLKQAILSEFGAVEIKIMPLRGLCSYYAEKGGLLLGFEC